MSQRPRIPTATQQALWARAAGRCQFRGCNKVLYLDKLTKGASNLGQVSHIVSWTPSGPRGHPERSEALATIIDNLILTCRDHGKLIDDTERVETYPESLLLEFKQEHEERVRLLTGSKKNNRTHVLLVQAPVNKEKVVIDSGAAHVAILPCYPAAEEPRRIDLTDLSGGQLTEELLRATSTGLKNQLSEFLQQRADGQPINDISIFSLAPIPLLVLLGKVLGETRKIRLFQWHRLSQDWQWPEEEEARDFYSIDKALSVSECGTDDLAILLSITHRIDRDLVFERLGRTVPVVEISASAPSRDFLSSRKRLEVFGYECRKVLDRLPRLRDQVRDLHLFAAAPAPVVIEFGRCVKPFHGSIIAYEFREDLARYGAELRLNGSF